MNDTPDPVARLVAQRYARMSPAERIAILVSMRQSAYSIVESSLPRGLTREQRRYAIAKRFYGDELPEAALLAHANYPDV
ncbi:MAG: hypothetical protein ABIQ86_15460 [Steroidobacteraceae bacterium]